MNSETALYTAVAALAGGAIPSLFWLLMKAKADHLADVVKGKDEQLAGKDGEIARLKTDLDAERRQSDKLQETVERFVAARGRHLPPELTKKERAKAARQHVREMTMEISGSGVFEEDADEE